jgi:hypothetical protein
MDDAKFDAALHLQLFRQQENDVSVSVRLRAPLTADEAARLQALGLEGADTRRRVLFGTVSPQSLSLLSTLDKVVQLSLDQKMTPIAADGK